MIGRLRRKFILINMLLVTVVLVAVLAAQLFSSAQRLSRESDDMLRRIAERPLGDAAEKFPIGKPDHPPESAGTFSMPVFTVLLASDGSVTLHTDNVDISEELAEDAARQAAETGQDSGVLQALGLRFVVRQSPEGTKVALADLSGVRATLVSQVLTALLAGAGALLAFFGVSVFLSGWALRPVARAWRQQQQFVADASHELKTPLTVILANTDILLAHPQDSIAQQQKWVRHTQDEAGRMKSMIDDLLFLARSDAAPQAAPMPLDLTDVCWSCILPFEPVAFERGVALLYEVQDGVRLLGNEGQLGQLLRILLDNACKYAGEKGEVRVTLRADAERAFLAVHNTGEAIPAEDLPHLFERFYRADKSRARGQDIGGYGLGLAIAERIVQAHRGKISVSSTNESGTTFTVALPLK